MITIALGVTVEVVIRVEAAISLRASCIYELDEVKKMYKTIGRIRMMRPKIKAISILFLFSIMDSPIK